MELINIPTKLYRVGKRIADDQGLWYDKDGNYTGLIHTVPGAAAAALPMGFDPIFRADGQRWISVTDTPAALPNWFSRDDMRVLFPRGYDVMEIEVLRYRRFFFEGFQHEVYSKDDEISIRVLDPALIWEGW